MSNLKLKRFNQRKRRVSTKISGTGKYPRLSVFRSNKYTYAQIIDDAKAATLVFVSSKEINDEKANKVSKSEALGELLAKKALAKKINKVKFDRSGYKYHGRIAAIANGARKGGLTI